MSQHKVVLLLGSNLGEQKKNVELALKKLKDAGNHISQTTEYLMSEPVEFVSSNIFCNIAAIIFTPLSPIQLLDCIKNIEVEMGRVNDSKVSGGYTDRIIDIDIIKYNELNFQSERLEIPHKKHLFERDFSRVLLKNFI
ncbi:2-amino-4-hydroxy-6-hydroxymethyldihydropteridine diphosphokinase [Chryseobacterium sp.]|jgi:2-amino-4-hydroxy-6-hydroxymethyldihydropteridine diphosphokinase|uniref:2-amino-4-hydroxy-6- hydroxymethyldihydropteridine diphosphokinase n=1 Tax=Chryseobacterium sp. TaxID=1871047 RepID=UPI002848FD72|nr:2-amino-4-hydroxy-6-hydroxymethyldihydropteridine diphosphokinase [Chryseobacterium sp.]MDR3026120.1 2-amino-4-hydroxy-6-hydroxymethyldihydropteridine diphosphokinase [Chryseobacterium sp.]